MSKFLIFAILTSLPLFSKIYYAKVEPYQTITLKSAVSAKVLSVDLEAEGEMVGDREIIHLDDTVDRADLNSSKQSLIILNSSLEINREMLNSLKKSLNRQKGYYQRMNRLKTASTTQKDNAFNSFVSAQNQYLSTKDKIESIKRQILDMTLKITRLEDIISKKSIRVKEQYLYKLYLRAGDYVNPNSPLAIVQDHSKAKLILFIEPSELDNIKMKNIYIDGEVTNYRVNKVWNSADERYISSYRVEIYVDTPIGRFSKLVKVEFK